MAMQAKGENVNEAWSRLARGDFLGAAQISTRLLGRTPNDPAVISCHAVSTWQLGGDIDVSITAMERAVALAPDDAWFRHNLAIIQASNGDLAAACTNFSKALELKPDDTEAFYGLSQNSRFSEETDLVRHMLGLYAGGALSPKAREFAAFGLAKAFADLGQHDRAIHFCIEANWLTRRGYDMDQQRAYLAELNEMVAADGFRALPETGDARVRPVFIVGMPRSGTTLVESILARHAGVHAGGELTVMYDVEQALLAWFRQNRDYKGGPHQMLAAVPGTLFEKNAAAVLARVKSLAGERDFSLYTDKLPENTQRLGLISRLFPKARVIHVRRHPLDCAMSNYFQRFARGNGFSFRQDLLGERIRQVADTMGLWKRALDLDFLDVSYERLVANPEPSIRAMLDFVGLDWDPACLTPEQAERRIMTASQFQAKQPINTGSLGRWRAYEAWIEPLIGAMGGRDWIAAEMADIADSSAG